jgi:hypothetical protein
MGTLAIAACNQPAPAPPAAAPALTPVERGRMLVIGGLCHDCHSPKKLGPKGPEPDMDKMLSGHPEGIGGRGIGERRPVRGPARRPTT